MFCTQLNTSCMLMICFYCEQARASLQASSQRQRHADLVYGLLARSQDRQKADSRQYWKRNHAFQQSTSNLTSHQDERKRKVNGKQYLPVCIGIPKQEDPHWQLLHTRLWHHLDDLTTGEVGELTSHAPPTWTWRKFYQDAMEKQRFLNFRPLLATFASSCSSVIEVFFKRHERGFPLIVRWAVRRETRTNCSLSLSLCQFVLPLSVLFFHVGFCCNQRRRLYSWSEKAGFGANLEEEKVGFTLRGDPGQDFFLVSAHPAFSLWCLWCVRALPWPTSPWVLWRLFLLKERKEETDKKPKTPKNQQIPEKLTQQQKKTPTHKDNLACHQKSELQNKPRNTKIQQWVVSKGRIEEMVQKP